MCSNGIIGTQNGDVCCSAACGSCGGSGCSGFGGGTSVGLGKEFCCTGTIRSEGQACIDTGSSPCIIGERFSSICCCWRYMVLLGGHGGSISGNRQWSRSDRKIKVYQGTKIVDYSVAVQPTVGSTFFDCARVAFLPRAPSFPLNPRSAVLLLLALPQIRTYRTD